MSEFPERLGASSVDAVDRIVRRALEKKPADRYQTAADTARAVAVTRRSRRSRRRSVSTRT